VVDRFFDLSGKIALVTGGNAGIGYGMAEGLARAGADVIIWGRRPDRNARAAEQLGQYGTRIAHRVVDIGNEQEIIAGFAAALAEFGRIDCLVANAAVPGHAEILEMTSEEWRRLLNVNLDGTFYTCREAARHMMARGEAGDRGGSIIIVGSQIIHAGLPGLTHYAAAKGGLNAMMKTLCVEVGSCDVRVNMICPGYTVTEMMESAGGDNGLEGPWLARSPINPLGRPADYQGIAVYLASDLSRLHTGDTLTIDGGMTSKMV
jgi:NAD(P)-dependent dehydrogenase (short-subunit alcohol dehydrogenase family)